MDDKKIKEIAAKFLQDENISVKNALLLGTLGLTHSVGDIADLAYGVNFSQYGYNEERKHALAEHLGYALLNWHILALAAGVSGDEIAARFIAEWETKRMGQQASIKDLLKHLKPQLKNQEATQNKQVDREPAQIDFTH